MENWKDIPGYEGRYQVSDLGNVRSVDRRVRTVSKFGAETTRAVRGVVLKPQKHSAGYLHVRIEGETRIIGHLVLEAFVGPRSAFQECAHGDGDKHNNRASNLRWTTPLDNAADRRKHGTSGAGEANANAKLTAADVSAVREARGPQRLIGEAFGIAQSQVSRIKRGVRWGHA